MANNNPDTSGLISLADRPSNERTTIQSMGGIASGKKRKEIKRIFEIIQGVRQESEKDPVEEAVVALLVSMNNVGTSTTDIIKGLTFVKELEAENQSNEQKIVYKYITPEHLKEIEDHINSVIGDTCDEPTP